MTQTVETPASILPREQWWWLGLVLLLILAGWLYLRGYNVSLPYLDHVDEPNHILSAQHLIDEGSARNPLRYDTYPPGMYYLHYLLLKHVKPPELHFYSVIPLARLITISAWMLAFVVIALIGYEIAHPLSGLMAAGIYLVNPWVVGRGHYALPDGYQTLFTLLALWLALVGALRNRRGFSTAAVYSLMLGIVFKTQAIFVAPFVVLLPLLGLRGWRGQDALRQTLWNCVRFGVFLFWLLLIYPTLEADKVHSWVAPSEAFGDSPLLHMQAHLALVLRQFQSNGGWLATALSGLLLWRYRNRAQVRAISIILLSALALLVGTSLFGRQSLRQFFMLGALLSLTWALGLTALLFVGEEALARFGRKRTPARWRTWILPGTLILLLAIGLHPAYRDSNALAHNHTLHDRRNELQEYMDTSLKPAPVLVYSSLHKVFSPSWGNFQGLHDYPTAGEKRWIWLPDKSIAKWRSLGAEYAIMPHYPLLQDPNTYYPDETTLLKTYPVDSNFRGPDMVVLRLYPMQQPHAGQLGSIRLVGYDISATQLQAGGELVFRHYWQAENPTESPHHVYNHLLDENGEIVAQVDYVPLWDDRRDSTTWDDPDEIMLGREFTLSLPPDLLPGVYQLVSGLYDPDNWQRLASPAGDDRLVLAEISVQASSA